MTIRLTYNIKTGHVKRNGAVIGRIETGLICGFIPFAFRVEIIEATNLKELLGKVRQAYA